MSRHPSHTPSTRPSTEESDASADGKAKLRRVSTKDIVPRAGNARPNERNLDRSKKGELQVELTLSSLKSAQTHLLFDAYYYFLALLSRKRLGGETFPVGREKTDGRYHNLSPGPLSSFQ